MRAVALAFVLLLLAAGLPAVDATTGTETVRVADWREGDAWSRQVVETSTMPFLGQPYTSTTEYVESARVEVGTLRLGDGHVHDVAWSNRSIQLAGYERPFLSRYANDLTTGARLLAPVMLGYTYGVATFNLLGLGLYHEEVRANNSYDYELFVDAPDLTLHDLLGGVDLEPGVAFERTLDLRPLHDVVIELAFEGRSFEDLEGRRVLRASLTQTRTQEGVTSAPEVATVWLEDGAPFPVRSIVEAVAHPVAYRLETRLLAFTPGEAPLPRGACEAPHPSTGPAVSPELGPLTVDGPADGDATLLLPLSEAVRLVRSPLANAGWTPPSDAVVTMGSYSVRETERGAVATWEIEFMTEDGSLDIYHVTREVDAFLPIPIDRVQAAGSGFTWGGAFPRPGGEPRLTVADMMRLAEIFHEEGATPGPVGFSVYAYRGANHLSAHAIQSTATREGTDNNGRLVAHTVADVFDGRTGLGVLRAWSDQDEAWQTRVLGLPFEVPRP
jgi:hypothetical protein